MGELHGFGVFPAAQKRVSACLKGCPHTGTVAAPAAAGPVLAVGCSGL